MTGRDIVDLVDIPEAWQVALGLVWLETVPDQAARELPPEALHAHCLGFITDWGNMLSDQIGSVRMALRHAIRADDPAIALAILQGVEARLEVLEADCVQWEEAAVISPRQRYHGRGGDGTVVPFPGPDTEGDGAA